MRIILASKSPRRKEFLSMVTTNFEIRVSDADETIEDGVSPFEVPRLLAIKKAESNDFVTENNLLPLYLRLSQAEQELKEKEKNAN